MNKNDRDAAIWELLMRAAIDLQKAGPPIQTDNAGVISLDTMLEKMANASNEDFTYGYCLYACMIGGLCFNILFDRMPEHDIQQMMIESETFRNQIHAN